MEKGAPPPKFPLQPSPQQAALHQDDASDDDENVKQLNECSALYLSLQVNKTSFSLFFFWDPSKTLVKHFFLRLTAIFIIYIYTCRIVLLTATEIGSLAKWVCFKFLHFLVDPLESLAFLPVFFFGTEVQALKACNERRKNSKGN